MKSMHVTLSFRELLKINVKWKTEDKGKPFVTISDPFYFITNKEVNVWFSADPCTAHEKKMAQSDISFCKNEGSQNLILMEKGVNWIENEGKIDTKCLKSVKIIHFG